MWSLCVCVRACVCCRMCYRMSCCMCDSVRIRKYDCIQNLLFSLSNSIFFVSVVWVRAETNITVGHRTKSEQKHQMSDHK